jgi:hypothetical protein
MFASTSITATAPAHIAGVVTVAVTNPDAQSGSRPGAFTYVAPQLPPPPTIGSVSPNSGPRSGGIRVIIGGANFVAGATVSFGGMAATNVSVLSSTSIAATAPAHAREVVNVVVTNPDKQSATLTNGFTYKGRR